MKIFLEINQIKKWLNLSKRNPRDAALFHLAFTTGFRISDLLALRKADLVDRSGHVVKVLRFKTRKTKKWLDKPLRDDCRQVVKDYLTTRTDDNPYMFPPKQTVTRFGLNTNKPMSRMTAHRLYKWYLGYFFDESELAGAATHTPRRSMGKIISEKSGRIEPASEFLGHTNSVSTRTYIDADGHKAKADDIVMEIEL
jgi:integrase/recombinase XerD